LIAPIPAFAAELAEVFPDVEFHIDVQPGWPDNTLFLRATAKRMRHRTVWVEVGLERVRYQVGRAQGATLREADAAHRLAHRRKAREDR